MMHRIIEWVTRLAGADPIEILIWFFTVLGFLAVIVMGAIIVSPLF